MDDNKRRLYDAVKERMQPEMVAKSWSAPMSAEAILAEYERARERVAAEFRLTRRVEPYIWMLMSMPPRGLKAGMDAGWMKSDALGFPPGSNGFSVRVPFWHNSEEEKWAHYDWVRMWCGEMRAVAVMTVSEVWMSIMQRPPGMSVEEAKAHFRANPPRNDRKRMELVQLALVSLVTDPQKQSKSALIHRPRKGKPYLGKWGYAFSEAMGRPISAGPDSTMGVVLAGDLYELIPHLNLPDDQKV